jgi:hypothetical protein
LISLWYFSFNLAAISLLSFFRLSEWLAVESRLPFRKESQNQPLASNC